MFEIKTNQDVVEQLARIADYLQIIAENMSSKSIGIRSRYADTTQRDEYKAGVFYAEDEENPGREHIIADSRNALLGFEKDR